ncbi:MAG: hypothetical protein IPJ48_10315 [Propionivibrio sp.]|uniref:Uncharacterized protein n=1 Tax=Candidatus Propionivibrio dominans TaxID=2954373 RepID=A0A9D7FE71_9RHOO|nr:hypothetical protein [Candidatus Propionivibrio dominans]
MVATGAVAYRPITLQRDAAADGDRLAGAAVAGIDGVASGRVDGGVARYGLEFLRGVQGVPVKAVVAQIDGDAVGQQQAVLISV